MGKKRMSSELTIMSLWPTLSDEGKRIIGDWIHSQRAKGDTVKPPRKLRSDGTRKAANEPPTD